MSLLGRIASIKRYPVKSMAGETVEIANLTAEGLQFDRLYAFESSGAPAGMLRLTGQERRAMLRYHPHTLSDGRVEVRTPSGERFPVDSKEMLAYLEEHLPDASRLLLTREEKPQTDVRPLSLLSVETVEALSAELGQPLDARRFRANLLLTMHDGAHAEDRLVGQTIGIGREAKLLLRERTPRCRFVTYEPDAPHLAEPLIPLIKLLDRRHQGRLGIYASVVQPGWVRCGDELHEDG
jgi:uncharacterized protein YcbX